MGSPVFHTDPSIALRGVSRPFDPIAAFSRIANLRRLQQRGQINQLQLEDAQSERERQKAIQDAARASGGDRAKFLQLLSQAAPVARFGFEDQFAKQKAAAGKSALAQRKGQLENAKATFELIGQLAGPLDALEKGGADPETLQVAYANSLGRLAASGVDTSKLPQEYAPGLAARAMVESVDESKRIDQALETDAIEERKRQAEVVSADRAASRALTARGLDIQEAKDPDRARNIRNREALMIGATATDYLTEANGDPDEALALLEEELRLPTASAEFRRLAPKIRNRIRERVRPGRSRGSTEADRVDEILEKLEQ